MKRNILTIATIILLFTPCFSEAVDTSKTFIAIRFSSDTIYGKYSNQMYFTQAQYDSMSAQDIQDEKDLRLNNWLTFKATEPIQVPATKAELKIMKIQVESDLVWIMTELEPKLSKVSIVTLPSLTRSIKTSISTSEFARCFIFTEPYSVLKLFDISISNPSLLVSRSG